MATTDIFIKTYRNDAPWLRECLRSIRHYWSGHREVIIVAPPQDKDVVRRTAGISKEKLVLVDERGFSGYIFQQAVKLNATGYTNADYVVFVDSDCIFTKPTSPSTYIRPDGKPIMLYTPYNHPQTETCQFWRPPTEKFLKRPVEHEFMRRHPMVYPREVLLAMDRWSVKEHGCPASQLMLRAGQTWGASEFNWMGAYAWYHQHGAFHWIDTTTEPLPKDHLAQFWSYGGLEHPSHADRLRAILKELPA